MNNKKIFFPDSDFSEYQLFEAEKIPTKSIMFQCPVEFTCDSATGASGGHPGDWVIVKEDEVYPISKELFVLNYHNIRPVMDQKTALQKLKDFFQPRKATNRTRQEILLAYAKMISQTYPELWATDKDVAENFEKLLGRKVS